MAAALIYSVVILALNPRKSGQIANKSFMIYYDRYRSHLAIFKSPKQNSCSNLLNWRIVSQPGVHNVMKNGVIAYFCYKQTNFRNVFSNCQRTIPGWLTLFYMFFFCRIAKFKMAAIFTSYFAKNHISSPKPMQIVNVIYGFVSLEGRGIWISQNKKHL